MIQEIQRGTILEQQRALATILQSRLRTMPRGPEIIDSIGFGGDIGADLGGQVKIGFWSDSEFGGVSAALARAAAQIGARLKAGAGIARAVGPFTDLELGGPLSQYTVAGVINRVAIGGLGAELSTNLQVSLGLLTGQTETRIPFGVMSGGIVASFKAAAGAASVHHEAVQSSGALRAGPMFVKWRSVLAGE